MPEYPPTKPDHMHIDKGHTPTKMGDSIGNAVSGGALGSFGRLQLGNQLDITLRERRERFWRWRECFQGIGSARLLRHGSSLLYMICSGRFVRQRYRARSMPRSTF